MKNIIIFYYNLTPTKIYQNHHKYWFYFQQNKYLFLEYHSSFFNEQDLFELKQKLQMLGIPIHDIILNKDNHIITTVNQKKYIMLKQIVKDDEISINDIIDFSAKTSNQSFLSSLYKNRHEWIHLWMSKIDYLEYQVSQFGMKYPYLRESFDYFVGVAENAISYCNEIYDHNYGVTHRRIESKMTYEEFYNPMNLMIDYSVRDVVEYFKFKLFYNYLSFAEVEYYLKYHLKTEEYVTFYARFLFPTPFFDTFEDIISGQKDEKEITPIIKKVHIYELFLKKIYFYISQYIKIPAIDWIIKKHR